MEKINLDTKQIIEIISGLGFRFNNQMELQMFINNRCLVQRHEGLATVYIDDVVVGKFNY
jgi:hypothetical protein